MSSHFNTCPLHLNPSCRLEVLQLASDGIVSAGVTRTRAAAAATCQVLDTLPRTEQWPAMRKGGEEDVNISRSMVFVTPPLREVVREAAARESNSFRIQQ